MSLPSTSQQKLIKNYQTLLQKYGDAPEASQWSKEGQLFRFKKLTQIASLTDKSILDIGCNIGRLYPFLIKKFNNIQYTGVDIVPDAISHASRKYPDAHFICRDILTHNLTKKYNYVFLSGIFNNKIAGSTTFLKELVSASFNLCTTGLAFNFISTHTNSKDENTAYHNPTEVFDYCINNLTKQANIHHHYERCDVAIFLYR